MLDRLSTTCSAIAVALTLAACGDDSNVVTPEAGIVAPLAFTMSLTHEGQFGGLEYPEELRGHLHIEIDEAGAVTGLISGYWQSANRSYTLTGGLSSFTGQVVDDRIEVDPGQASMWPSGQLEWDSLSFRLLDGNGDGAADGASGTIVGGWTIVAGDIVDTSNITGDLSAGRDTEPAEIRMAPVEFGGTNEFLPTDRVRISFSEPLAEAAVGQGVEVFADGVALAGRLVGNVNRGYLTYVYFVPDEYLPFASEITVDVNGLSDPSGNPTSARPDPLPTVGDPGQLGAVPSFEGDFTGWIKRGTVDAVGDYAGVTPTDGAMQVRLSENSQLIGYIDVTDPVTPFGLSFNLFTQYGEIFEDYSAAVRLYTAPDEYQLLFDAFLYQNQNAACMDCDNFGYQLGPITSGIDLSGYVGQRVFVQIEVQSLFFIGFERHALLIDNVP